MTRLLPLIVVLVGPALRVAAAQQAVSVSPDLPAGVQLASADRGPVFFTVPFPGAERVDARGARVFRRRVTVNLRNVTLEVALREVARQADFALTYSADLGPLDARVSLRADAITVAAALTELLLESRFDVELTARGKVALVARAGAVPPRRAQQGGGIAGRVTEARTGRPLAGATVIVEGTSYRASTRKDGDYTLGSMPLGVYNVTARVLGHRPLTKKVQVGPDSTVHADFALEEAAASLEQVVTTVTGNQRKLEVGNTIATIAADSVVATAPITNLSDIISGRAAGVQVYLNGGLTGASPQITIRGQNSFTLSNQPLLVVDGVRVDNTPAVAVPYPNTVTDDALAGRFNDLDPEDIESIEVVKGPSAATLYGTDAANGVILVKTKHGRAGRQHWEAYAEGGLLTLDRNRLWSTYHAFGHDPVTGAPTRCLNLARIAGACVLDSLTNFDPIKVPALSAVGTGNRAQYGMQTSGGSGQTRYFAAGGYEEETGVLKMPAPDVKILETLRGAPLGDDELHPNAVQRANLRANLVTALASTADLTLSGAIIHQRSRIPSPDIWASGARGPGYRDVNDGWPTNPGRPAQIFAERFGEIVTHATPSGTVNWRPFSWLTAHGTGGLDFSSDFFDELMRAGEGAIGVTSVRTNNKSNVSLYTGDLGATAAFDLGPQVSSKTSVGAQYTRRLQQDNTAQGLNLAPGVTTVAGAATQIAAEANLETIVAGTYAEQTFGLNNRMFITGAVRLDGASAFGTAFKTAAYPKASVSWLISDEPFLRRAPGLSTLRLRAAYGASGVQPSSTASLPAVNLGPAVANGNVTTGGTIGALGNPNLGPERQAELEAGLDADFVGSRVQLEATYYRKKSTDALVNLPLPASLGVFGPFGSNGMVEENVGSVENAGYEALLTLHVLQSRPLGWDVSLNGSTNKNKLLKLAPGVTSARFGEIVPGYPLFSTFGIPFLGYKDANGNGVIEPNEVTVGSTQVFLGQHFPTTQLTAATTVTVLNGQVQIGAQFDRRQGFAEEDAATLIGDIIGNARAVTDPKAPLGEQARAVAFLAHRSFAGYIENGSFTRFRELSVTYNVPAAITRHVASARNASLTFAGRNLALWTRFTGVDPEMTRDPGGFISPGQASDSPYTTDASSPPSTYWILRVRLGW